MVASGVGMRVKVVVRTGRRVRLVLHPFLIGFVFSDDDISRCAAVQLTVGPGMSLGSPYRGARGLVCPIVTTTVVSTTTVGECVWAARVVLF